EGLSWDRVDTQQQASLVDSLEDGPNHFILVSQRGELIRLDCRNLETARLEVPFSGEVSSAVILDGSRELMVTQFSGVRKIDIRSEEHTSELQSRENLVCRLLLEKKN